MKNKNNLVEDDDEDDEEDNDPILTKLKTQLKMRVANGILGLSRLFKIMDDDGSKTLSFAEFRKAMKDLQLSLSDAELIGLFKKFGIYLFYNLFLKYFHKYLDINKSNSISYDNFISTIAVKLFSICFTSYIINYSIYIIN